MPKTLFAPFVAIALGACATAAPSSQQFVSIPGVQDEETVIRSGVIEEYHYGGGDSLYVRDRENKWFRLGLNDGCFRNGFVGQRVLFSTPDLTGRIDTMASVILGETGRTCQINSIRRSVAPPQVDSKSPIPIYRRI